jgi:hypothetical protein
MKGDFSRLTFDPAKQFTRVLMQQGRVQLDADWNEQAAILLHYLQALAADLIGPFGGPEADWGFEVGAVMKENALADLNLGQGRYYVDGLLCENRSPAGTPQVSYFHQPSLRLDPETDKLPGAPFLVYLDVWERHITYLVNDGIREVALGGPDTATRAEVVWQVRVTREKEVPPGVTLNEKTVFDETVWPKWTNLWQPTDRGRLKARAKVDGDPTEPCTASPEAGYRGAENQLYRVEVQAQERGADGLTTGLTFKWSRENGSVVFPVRSLKGWIATLESLGRDDASGLKRGDWVEIVDDDSEVGSRSWSLLQVEEIDPAGASVTLRAAAGDNAPHLPSYKEGEEEQKHAMLRRWDHKASPKPDTGLNPRGAVLFVFQKNPKPDAGWLTLEDGIQVQFQAGSYRAGDYWLIPARTATGDVEWPGPVGQPEAVPPHGVEHHYAPLAILVADPTASGGIGVRNRRRSFKRLGLP